MLVSLKFSVTFPNGKTFKQDLKFNEGHTAITGKNGKGKSLAMEMIQYAYWGTKALRGAAEDYKKLSVIHVFKVRGQEYTVYRQGSTVTLHKGDLPHASGTTAVNKAIAEIFGYSFEVFKVANACNQGKITELGDALPSARKKLVDDTIGLSTLDTLTKFIAESEKNLRGQISGIESVLTEPTEPSKPEGYVESSTLMETINGLRTIEKEQNSIQALANMVVQMPKPPEPCLDVDKLQEYKELEQQRINLNAAITAVVSQISGIPDALLSMEEIQQYEKDNIAYSDWLLKSALRRSLESKKVEHNCPSCKHQWFDSDPRLSELQSLPATMEKPKYDSKVLEAQKLAVAKAAIKAEGGAKLIELNEQMAKMPPSKTADITRIQNHLNSMVIFDRELKTAKIRQEARDEAVESLKDPKFKMLEQLPQLSTQLVQCSVYEAQLTSYEKAKTKWQEDSAKLAVLKVEAEAWSNAKKAVSDLRARVKGYLLPSLNKVSSALINAMTGGELSWITVNDNFDITVEGQRLETLSGAGKSVANLALRIGLGQVLTNRVFSVLMLDEIDESCDADRAGFIAECMGRLTSQISQIVQISHKQIKADHYVSL